MSSKLKFATINVEGMTCQNCVKHVLNALSDVKGVSDVNVSLELGAATFNMDDSVSEKDVLDAVLDAGYKASF